MHDGNGLQRIVARAAASSPGSGDTIALAQGSGGCACGALSGSCTCSNGGAAHSSFVYVLGTVDCEFPDQSVSEEFQAVADTVGITQRDDESERSFVYRVLTANSRDANGASIRPALTIRPMPQVPLAKTRQSQDLATLRANCAGY